MVLLEQFEERQEGLIELLKQVHPDTWDDGGGPGTVTAFGHYLVITQTLEMHEIVGGRYANKVSSPFPIWYPGRVRQAE